MMQELNIADRPSKQMHRILLSPQIIIKALQRRVRILHIFLRLLAHVEDRTIFTCAQDILVQGSLTPLALCPQS